MAEHGAPAMTASDMGASRRDTSSKTAPVSSAARIASLDSLRGLAVLGILVVNAMAFAWPMQLALSPEAAPFAHNPPDQIAGWFRDVFFTDKFRTLFTLLFGVSIFLVGGAGDDKHRSRLLRRRLFWLAVFGLLHGLAFWYGDILLLYAWAGLFMMLLRGLSARMLLWIGGGLTLAFALMQAAMVVGMTFAPEEITAAMAEDGVTTEQILALVGVYQSGWAGAMAENAKSWLTIQTLSLTTYVFAVLPLMMLGLGLFKSGFMTGYAPRRVYWGLIALTVLVLTLHGLMRWPEYMDPSLNSAMPMSMTIAGLAPLVSLGYASIVILALKGPLAAVVRALAPVGRMAFTNYLAQTLIMTSLFYMPWGPHLFGKMGPAGLWGVIVAVWAVQLIWSPLWLARFRMGPLEWVWRRLTYGPIPPITAKD